MERLNPSFIGRRQQHINFGVTLAMEFTPGNTNECAGLALLQNENYQIRCVVTLNVAGDYIVRLIRREAGIDQVLNEQKITAGRVYFKVEAKEQDYQFSIGNHHRKWHTLGNPVDGRVLSTPVAGGFHWRLYWNVCIQQWKIERKLRLL